MWIILGGFALVFLISAVTMLAIWLIDDGGDDGEEEG